MIKFYANANPLFPNTLKIRLALIEAEASYELVPMDFSKGQHRSPEYLSINPHGKVPAMTDGEVKLAESDAILWYIAEKFPNARLLPENAAGRARTLQFCEFTGFYLYTNIYDYANHSVSWEPEKRSKDIAERARTALERAIDVLETVTAEREYLAGPFTIADLAAASSVRYWQERLTQYAELKPATAKWFERITARESWKKATAL